MTDLRAKGKECLEKYLSIEKNIQIIEKNIHENCKNNDDYINNIMEVCKKIRNKVKLRDILVDIKGDKLGWNDSLFDHCRDVQEEEINYITNPFEVEEGIIDCSCGSSRTISYAKQTRGSDEATSVIVTCIECKRTWMINN